MATSRSGSSGGRNGRKNEAATLSGKGSVPLVPPLLLAPLWFISLAVPNLVYSGITWYDTLHIVKWAIAGVPVGIAILVGGIRLVRYGTERIDFKIDPFGAVWLALLVYTTLQAFWVPLSSKTTFIHELLCFAAVWGFYLISWNSFPNRTIRPLLWLANINAAINVLFAELQIRHLSGFTSLILPTPGNYIGNTGQQNMFGLWMAICIMSSVYLYIAYATTPSGKKRHPAVTLANLAVMAVNVWGLWNSTSRSAILSLGVALVVLAFVTLRQFGNEDLSDPGKRFSWWTIPVFLSILLDLFALHRVGKADAALLYVLYGILAVLIGVLTFVSSRRIRSGYVRRLVHVTGLFLIVLVLGTAVNHDRSTELISKTVDMVQNAHTFGGRDGIWATSRAMFKMYPWTGVGIGQYKWHYLEAQREMFKTYPDKPWQYTHWAHNEFLQWFCEGGVVGGILLLSMWAIWGIAFLVTLWRKEHVALEVIWACALVTLISFNALWTRPFHRIENILWLALAFAVSNRDMVSVLMPRKALLLGKAARACGLLFVLGALGGLAYLADGMVGDKMLRRALSTPDATVQRNLIERASGHLMVRSDAMKNLGYHYLRLGDQMRNIQLMGQGFQLLWQHFLSEPHTEEFRILIDWSQRFQLLDILKTLASYLKPGTYRFGIQEDAIDNDGNAVNATVLIPIQESGGMKIMDSPLSD